MNKSTTNAKSLRLTKQAAGTLQTVGAMIASETYCPTIIQQIDSVIGLLRTTKKELLAGHLEHCLEDKIKTDRDKTIRELMDIFKLNA